MILQNIYDDCKCIFRPGDAYEEKLKIKDQTVHGFPDVRFIAYPSPKVVAVTEVFFFFFKCPFVMHIGLKHFMYILINSLSLVINLK